MSLPDVPNTLREKYYSVMAGQNGADILPDIETAPSTENRYLDYIAKHGGGGGGDVTKAYVDEQDAKKTDKVTSAISGNFAGLDANGNLTDSGKKATDFATASDMSNVQGVIPSTATTQNKLATASDVADENISSTSTTSPLTDSADARVQGLTVHGRSEVVDGAIKSIGDAGWGVVDLGTLTWTLYDTTTNRSTFYCTISGCTTISDPTITPDFVSSTLNAIAYNDSWTPNTITQGTNGAVIVNVDPSITTTQTLATALSGVLLYYPLADTAGATPTFGITSKDGAGQGTAATITTGLPLRSTLDGTVYDELTNEKVITRCEVVEGEVVPLTTPTETPLTSTEKSALASLRTYDHTTYIDATDAPTMTVDYLLNTDNGKAVAGVDNKIIAIKSVSWTGTGATTNSITFPEKPLMVLGYTQDSDYDTFVRGIMPFFFHPSTAMLRIFWKRKSETSHTTDYTYNSSYVLTINGNNISWTGLDASQALNSNGVEYTIYYI